MLGLGWAGHKVLWMWASSVHFVRRWGRGSGEYFRHFYSSSSLNAWRDSPHWCVPEDLSFPHGVIEFCLLHLCCPKFSSALKAVDFVMSTSRLHSALLPHTPSSRGLPIMLQIFQLVDWDWRAGTCFDTKRDIVTAMVMILHQEECSIYNKQLDIYCFGDVIIIRTVLFRSFVSILYYVFLSFKFCWNLSFIFCGSLSFKFWWSKKRYICLKGYKGVPKWEIYKCIKVWSHDCNLIWLDLI